MDHLKQIDLTMKAVEITKKILKVNGNAVYKVFQGETTPEFITYVKSIFSTVQITKTDEIRKQSIEIYLLFKQFNPSIV
jgi:23S rRNA (uridine2552-2'-O)-methyltransferase